MRRCRWGSRALGWEGFVYCANWDKDRVRDAIDLAAAAILFLAWCAGKAKVRGQGCSSLRRALGTLPPPRLDLQWIRSEIARLLGVSASWVREYCGHHGAIRIFVRGRRAADCDWAAQQIRDRIPSDFWLTVEPEPLLRRDDGEAAQREEARAALGMASTGSGWPQRWDWAPAEAECGWLHVDYRPANMAILPAREAPGPPAWPILDVKYAAWSRKLERDLAEKAVEKPAPGPARSERDGWRHQIDELLRRDAREHPEHATARRLAVMALAECMPGLGVGGASMLLRDLHHYEGRRGGGKRPAWTWEPGYCYPGWHAALAVYERTRHLP